MRQHVLAEFRSIYLESPTPRFADLIKGINKDLLVRVSTWLIGRELYLGGETDNGELIGLWFTEPNRAFAEDLCTRINLYEENEKREPKIVFIISVLRILQAGLELIEEGRSAQKTDEQVEQDLFLAMLVANQDVDDLQMKDTGKIETLFPDMAAEVGMLHQTFPVHDIMNFDLPDYGFCQLIKALLLFVFLETAEDGRNLLARLYQYYSISHWRDYINLINPLLFAWTRRDQPSSIDLIVSPDADYTRQLEFIEKIAVNDYIRMEDVDYIRLRERPLVRLDPQTFRIIHPIFLVDKIYKSLFFLLKRLNDISPRPVKGDFRGWYTASFSEGACFRHLVDYAFAGADVKRYDQDLRELGIAGPPDGYIRTGQQVFLMENKDILIHSNIKGSYDIEALVGELKKKLLVKSDGRPVGIGQLVANIRLLLNGKNNTDAGFDKNVTCIYPILILHDPMFDAPGLNKLPQTFLAAELAVLTRDGLDVGRVKPLTIMNVDSLIMMAHLLNTGRLRLEALLDEYQDSWDYEKRATSSSMKDLLQAFNNSCISLHGYLPDFLRERFGRDARSMGLVRYFFDKFEVDGREQFFPPAQ